MLRCVSLSRLSRIISVAAVVLAVAPFVTISVTCSAYASGISDCGLGKTDCRDMVGKTIWISIPSWNKAVIEVSRGPSADSQTVTKLRSGASFLIKSISKDQTTGYYFHVALPDGRTGYVSNFNWMFMLDFNPVERDKERAAECARRGQPKIGMTSTELIETCWQRPVRIIKKTTAAGIQEVYVYGRGHSVTLLDGKVSEILEAR